MNPLKGIKKTILERKGFGLFTVFARSNWRRQRLLILCYHGVAMGDEHASDPWMFMQPDIFARRMEILQSCGCHVLGLSEALRLLQTGKLPERSVVLTFDDGWADFYASAFPILRKHGFPATVYLTTYYCTFNRPIFRFALRYMASKRRNAVVEPHGIPWLPKRLDLNTTGDNEALIQRIDEYAKNTKMSGQQKDDLACEFASIIGFDYQALTRKRLFHLMNPQEVAEMARLGIDFQLHTHRHRTPLERSLFLQEIEENRRVLQELTGVDSHDHFCYPSGANRADFLPWLSEGRVRSAVTGGYGYCAPRSDSLLLPRFPDQGGTTDDEFEAWVKGFAAIIPRRRVDSLDVAPE
jgi:peptidoglycan/xylan/chitin deacetylase (PgdA/CDA1 family)